MKNRNRFNFFENAWIKKTNEVNEREVLALKRKKRFKTVMIIFSVVCAVVIWIYACAVSLTDVKFQSPVTVKRVAFVESKGYKVEYNSTVKINYTVRGTAFAISQIPSKGVDVYADLSTVNLSEITETKIIQLPLIMDLPSDITCTEKSQEYIEVIITKINIE